jgi:type IV conjugative transfer system protein TraL
MRTRIPRTLDRPIRCLGIPIDSIIVALSVYSTFVLLAKGVSGIFIAIISANLFSRYRSKSFFRNVLRFIYWYFPAEFNAVQGVQGHQRRLRFRGDEN